MATDGPATQFDMTTARVNPSPATGGQVPRLPLAAMALLVLISLAGVIGVRWAGTGSQQQADAATVARRSLHFADRPDGSVAVSDARSGELLLSVAPGTNAFLRSTMRSMARERRRQGQGPAEPFELLARADGRLTLLDPGTARRIDLESFGPSNAAVFIRLLPAAGPAPAAHP